MEPRKEMLCERKSKRKSKTRVSEELENADLVLKVFQFNVHKHNPKWFESRMPTGKKSFFEAIYLMEKEPRDVLVALRDSYNKQNSRNKGLDRIQMQFQPNSPSNLQTGKDETLPGLKQTESSGMFLICCQRVAVNSCSFNFRAPVTFNTLRCFIPWQANAVASGDYYKGETHKDFDCQQKEIGNWQKYMTVGGGGR